MHDNQRSDRPRSGSRGRSRSRSGGRSSSGSYRSSSNSGSGNGSSSSSSPRRPAAPVKTGLWQKFLSLFTGKPKSPSRSSSSRPADSYGDTQNGHRRFESPRENIRSSAPREGAREQRQARKPELVEVSSPKIYVGNLSFDASESDLFDLFNGVGQVQNAEIVSNKYTQKSKGFAFVTMLTVDEARRAVTELHDKDFMGRKLVVSGAKTSDTASSRSQDDERPRSFGSEEPEQDAGSSAA